ncbi:MAG: Sec-independent protein translocase subunit TatA [Mycobacteriaceae bacterium]|nr:Sec-independent protein translocase subunit TatA [Mycobacteriaceae bacterium]
MGAMSPWHWAIVVLVLVLLFGSKRLPDAARGLGRSLRIFKSEVSKLQDDGKPAQPAPPQQLPPGQQSGAVAQPHETAAQAPQPHETGPQTPSSTPPQA